MQIAETLNEGLKRGYRVTVPAAEVAARIDGAVQEVAGRVQMPGFRPGKVPLNLVRKMHGPAIRAEAMQTAVSDSVQALLRDEKLRPATQPEVALESGALEGEDIVFTTSMEVLPTIEQVNIDGIALEKLVVAPDPEQVDKELRELADGQKRFEDAPEGHAAVTGDEVELDFTGTVDGEAFEGGTGEGMRVVLGAGRLIPGFEDQLTGVTVGDERTVDVTFPDDYPEQRLAGKPARFAVRVSAVRQAPPVEIDDALATNLGLESLDKLKAVLAERLSEQSAQLTRTHMKRKLLDHLAATHDFAVPQAMVDAEFDAIWKQVEEEAKAGGGEPGEDERAEYRRIAERRVRLGLLLSEIGQAANVQITQGEMSNLIMREAARYPNERERVVAFFRDNAQAQAQLRAPLFEEKVVDHLLGKAEVTERQVGAAELQAAIEDEDETPLALRVGGHDHGHVHGPDCDHDHDHAHEAA